MDKTTLEVPYSTASFHHYREVTKNNDADTGTVHQIVSRYVVTKTTLKTKNVTCYSPLSVSSVGEVLLLNFMVDIVPFFVHLTTNPSAPLLPLRYHTPILPTDLSQFSDTGFRPPWCASGDLNL